MALELIPVGKISLKKEHICLHCQIAPYLLRFLEINYFLRFISFLKVPKHINLPFLGFRFSPEGPFTEPVTGWF